MLGRLGLHDDVVDALLGIGKTQDAFRYALQMGIINQFPASAFLEPAYASGDKTLYLNIYKALEEVGAFSPLHVRPRGRPRFGRAADGGGGGYDDGDDDDDDGEGGGDPDGRYFSVYQELWSAVVEMEGI
ncbi:hypothetical protein DFJ73DRAFT_807629 [Zopfochytrium polystomum]|nr:hypothetical protein DFJ73DRAFT_807629 [Zopfochytrium polystomum]